MMRLLTVLSTFILLQGISAQEVAWEKQLVGNLNVTQNSFDNWTAGGEDAWSWQIDVSGSANKTTNKFLWNNSGKFSFGKTRVGDLEARKSADEIKLESVLTLLRGVIINPYVAVSGQTQFVSGYIYPTDTGKVEVSDFFDPAYFTQSIGMGYSPLEELALRMGASFKETITSEHPAPFADDPDTDKIEEFKAELGAELIADYSKTFNENLQLNSKLELFSNLNAFEEIDANWDTTISAKVSKYISTNLNLRIFYDRDISPKRQMKQTLSLGVSYVFI